MTKKIEDLTIGEILNICKNRGDEKCGDYSEEECPLRPCCFYFYYMPRKMLDDPEALNKEVKIDG